MTSLRRLGTGISVVLLALLASCVDEPGPVLPDFDSAVLSLESGIVDGSTDPDLDFFYFLPPLADKNPSITGDFNPNLLPAMRVCELTFLGGECATKQNGDLEIAVERGPGSAAVGNGQYQISWDTERRGPEGLDPDLFYRLEILIDDQVMGWLELDPQDPNGPGQSDADAYAFRVGETIPVKFWLGTDALCVGDAYVTECIAGAVIDQEGGSLALTEGGPQLGLDVAAGSLPEANPVITVVIERIDAEAFLQSEGEACIPLFDAPQFGECFRVTTFPVLDDPLLTPALVSLCIDPGEFATLKIPEDQKDELTMIRYDNGTWEGLADASGNCPVPTASLVPVPDGGIFRRPAIALNALARMVGPQELWAKDIRLGGLTSSFSRFRYALPGGMEISAGDGAVIQDGAPNDVTATVLVTDHVGTAIEGATVHFATADGTVSAADVTTAADGLATVTWSVDVGTIGGKTLTASALGLVDGEAPTHSANFTIDPESIEFTATVVGPPASIGSFSPTDPITGVEVTQPAGALSIQVLDGQDYPVEGAPVNWSGDGSFTGGTTTGADGTATTNWTLGENAGTQTATATIGGGTLSQSFTAEAEPGPAFSLSPTIDSDGSEFVGAEIALTITVEDEYGNDRQGDAVTWSATAGGSVAGDPQSGVGGLASAVWTLGGVPGGQSATVSVGDLTHTFSVAAECFDGYGIANVDGTQSAGEWACARSLAFEANISGGSVPARVFWMNDGNNLYLSVRVQQASLDKANSVRFDFDNDGDGVVGAGDDVIGYDAGTNSFLDEYLNQKCVNRSQSGCGVSDGSVDGSGAVGNDGTWTTYELAHPLSGDSRDFSVGTGDPLGFFVTLRIGNGAQGNTQFPGFRLYEIITIVGL